MMKDGEKENLLFPGYLVCAQALTHLGVIQFSQWTHRSVPQKPQ